MRFLCTMITCTGLLCALAVPSWAATTASQDPRAAAAARTRAQAHHQSAALPKPAARRPVHASQAGGANALRAGGSSAAVAKGASTAFSAAVWHSPAAPQATATAITLQTRRPSADPGK